jgi:hypothetical protein
MTPNVKDDARRKLRWSWIILTIYILLMFVALNYASRVSLPYQVVAVGGALNMAILFTFIFAIRRLYLRSREHLDLEGGEIGDFTSTHAPRSDRRRLRWLWVGVVIASLTCLNALAYIPQIPYQAAIGIFVLYVGIGTAFIFEIRRVQKRLRARGAPLTR